MSLYEKNDYYTLYLGKMQEEIKNILDNSISSIVTDPPYELNFMGKSWDNSGVAFQKETWQECLRVLKPGGYMVSFGGARTMHRIACAIEDAGFVIRDCIMWVFGNGFAKSSNIGLSIDRQSDPLLRQSAEYKCENEWAGWGTSLKPAYEPIILAQKPVEGRTYENVIKWGVGGINIDACRFGDEITVTNRHGNKRASGIYILDDRNFKKENPPGRFPSNLILTYDENDFNEVCKNFPEIDKNKGSASRYFYCVKASTKDRNDGLGDGLKNTHLTVKPCELMQYLVRLVTPKNGIVLDPFMGSGSTGKAAMYENKEKDANYKFIGIEMTEEYLPVCKARIDFALIKEEITEEYKFNLINIFGD